MIERLKKILGSLSLIAVVAFLGALSGQNWKWLRRFILPAVVTLYAFYIVQNWRVLTIYLMAFPLSIGYGTVSPDDDKPSFLGKLAYNLFPKSTVLQNVFCRGIVGLLISLSMLSVPILTENWVSYLLGSIGIIGIWVAVSWRGFGSIPVKIFGKVYTLLNVDLTVYGVTACGIVLIINGWLR